MLLQLDYIGYNEKAGTTITFLHVLTGPLLALGTDASSASFLFYLWLLSGLIVHMRLTISRMGRGSVV